MKAYFHIPPRTPGMEPGGVSYEITFNVASPTKLLVSINGDAPTMLTEAHLVTLLRNTLRFGRARTGGGVTASDFGVIDLMLLLNKRHVPTGANLVEYRITAGDSGEPLLSVNHEKPRALMGVGGCRGWTGLLVGVLR